MGMYPSLTRRHVLLILAALPVAGCPALATAGEAVDIKWSRLAPPPPVSARTFLPKPGQSTAPTAGDTGSEGGWMSGGKATTTAPPAVATDLAGQRIRIGGYVVPLDFNATRVTEFLLVPFVGACVHVPPPPANQIIYVTIAKGLELQGMFDPVYVTGPLEIDYTSTGLADAGYRIAADKIDPKPQTN